MTNQKARALASDFVIPSSFVIPSFVILLDVSLLLILRKAVVQLAETDAELRGGGVAVAAVAVEGRKDVLPLDLFQRHGGRRLPGRELQGLRLRVGLRHCLGGAGGAAF